MGKEARINPRSDAFDADINLWIVVIIHLDGDDFEFHPGGNELLRVVIAIKARGTWRQVFERFLLHWKGWRQNKERGVGYENLRTKSPETVSNLKIRGKAEIVIPGFPRGRRREEAEVETRSDIAPDCHQQHGNCHAQQENWEVRYAKTVHGARSCGREGERGVVMAGEVWRRGGRKGSEKEGGGIRSRESGVRGALTRGWGEEKPQRGAACRGRLAPPVAATKRGPPLGS